MAKKILHGGLPLFAPPSDWVPPSLSELPSWKGQKLVGFDTEFKDLTLRQLGIGVRRGAKMCGYSFAFEDGRKWYIPLRHEGGGNVDEKNGLQYLRDQFANFDGELIGLGLQQDIDFANSEGAFLRSVKFIRDVGVIDALIYELQLSYKLAAVLKRLGLPLKNEELLRAAALEHGYDPKQDIYKLHSKYVGPYGGDDSLLPILAYRALQEAINRNNLQRCVDIESRLLPVLLRMRQRGVPVDFDQLDRVQQNARKAEKENLDLIKHETGVDIGVGNTDKKPLLAAALQAIGVTVRKNKKGIFLIDKALYGSIDHPVAKAIGNAKKAAKRQSFCEAIRRYVTNGRIHTTFVQTVGGGSGKAGKKKDTEGPTSGRLSSRHLNIQQQPNDAEFRSIFCADPGSFWACLDYSQQEPRMTTHIAARMGFPGAKEAAQAYRDDPTLDNHEFMSKITGIVRDRAKALFLGLCYGEGGAKLCHQLKLPTRWAVRTQDRGLYYFGNRTDALKFRKGYKGDVFMWETAGEEGQKIIDQFHARAPYIKALADACRQKVRDTGQIVLYCGRILHFPMDQNGKYMEEHKGLNRKVQPECGYMMKEAIIEIDRTMPDTFVHTTVHDELDGCFSSFKEVRQVAEIMRNIKPDSLVPYRLDIEHGGSWGNLKLLCSVDGCEQNVPNKKVEKIYCKDHYEPR